MAGTLMSYFDCTTNPALAVIGRLAMRTGTVGCLSQVLSDHPCGTHVLDCNRRVNQMDEFPQFRLGSICILSGGIDACQTATALAPTTWGRIKHSYHPILPGQIGR